MPPDGPGSFASSLVSSVFGSAPFWLSLILGAVIALIGWSRSPKAAMAVLAGVALAFLSVCGESIMMRVVGMTAKDERMYYFLRSAVHFFGSVAQGAAFVFICLAAFIDRHVPSPLDKPQ